MCRKRMNQWSYSTRSHTKHMYLRWFELFFLPQRSCYLAQNPKDIIVDVAIKMKICLMSWGEDASYGRVFQKPFSQFYFVVICLSNSARFKRWRIFMLYGYKFNTLVTIEWALPTLTSVARWHLLSHIAGLFYKKTLTILDFLIRDYI